MNRIARIVFTGLLAGLVVFIVGNLVDLFASFFVRGAETTGKMDLAPTILLTFLFDLFTGLFMVVAFGVVRKGLPTNKLLRTLTFTVILFFINIVPRAADAYVNVILPNAVIGTWIVGWIIEAVIASFIVVLLYPEKNSSRDVNPLPRGTA